MKFAVIAGQPHCEIVAVLFDACALWRPKSGLNLVRQYAFFIAELKRGHTVAVKSDIHVRRAGLQGGASHEQRFAMWIHSLAEKLDVGFEVAVTGNFHPDKVKIVFVEPDVFAARSDGVGLLRGIESELAGLVENAHIAFAFENAETARSSLGCGGLRQSQNGNK